jgi:TolB protein
MREFSFLNRWFFLGNLIIFFCVVMLVKNAYPQGSSEIHLGVETTRAMKINLAISNFLNECPDKRDKDLSEEIVKILFDDLNTSEYFNIVSRPDSNDPMTLVQNLNTINFKKWALFGAESLITGKFCYEGEKLKIEGRLYDISLGQMITGIAYRAKETEFRLMVHKFADEVIKRISGVPGVFQTKIAFVSNSTSKKEIYMMDYDGYNLNRLTNFQTITLLPEWSPDRKSLAFVSFLGKKPGIYTIDLKTLTSKRLLPQDKFSSSPCYSPDGNSLIYSGTYEGGNSEICIIDLATSKVKRLTFDPSIDTSPCYSPTGREIAFTSNRSGAPHIYIMDLEGLNIRRISYGSAYNDSPAWSPRGDLIAYIARVGGNFCICTVDPSGENFTNLTPDAGDNENPSWSSDGMNIIFSSTRTGHKKLYIINYRGEIKKSFEKIPGDCETPSWSKIQN